MKESLENLHWILITEDSNTAMRNLFLRYFRYIHCDLSFFAYVGCFIESNFCARFSEVDGMGDLATLPISAALRESLLAAHLRSSDAVLSLSIQSLGDGGSPSRSARLVRAEAVSMSTG